MRLIDADFLKEWVDEYLSVFKKYDKGTIKGFVDHAPTIEPKRGEWIESGFEEIKCSVCGSAWDYCDNDCERFNFCPNCGAQMKGATDGNK